MTALAEVNAQQLEDARRVLRVLTAAFPTYPVGDDTAELYLAVIAKDMSDFATAMRVVSDWATTQLLFPKPVELTEAYLAETERRQRKAESTRRAQEHHVPGTFACRNCEDQHLVVVTFAKGGALYTGVVPCDVCRPEEREYQREGHLAGEHDIFACEHPRCEVRAEKRGKRGRAAR